MGFFQNNSYNIAAILVGLVLLAIVLFSLIKPAQKTVEGLILETKDVIENLAATGSALQAYAQDYVNTRKQYEGSASYYLNSVNGILTTVQGLQQGAKTAYNNTNGYLTEAQTSVTNVQTYAGTTTTALTAIQNLISGGTPTSPTAGIDFGTNVQKILDLQTTVNNDYTRSRTQLDLISTNYNNAATQEKTVSDNLSNATNQLNLLNSYIRQLLSDIRSSPEYNNLDAAITRANKLVGPLTDAISKVTDTNTKTTLQNLLASVNSAITTATNYRDNIISLFTDATNNATNAVSGTVGKILTVFTSVVALVGTVAFSGPYPFTTPVVTPSLAPGDNSILFYYNGVQKIYADIVTAYNTYITSYNTVVTNVNSVQTLVNNTVSGMGTSINAAITGYNTAQNILKPYLTGNVTPMGPYTVPLTQSPLTTIGTATPYTYTTRLPQGI